MLSNKVSEIMAKEVITADVSSTILTVMETMAGKNVGGVIVTENQRPEGVRRPVSDETWVAATARRRFVSIAMTGKFLHPGQASCQSPPAR